MTLGSCTGRFLAKQPNHFDTLSLFGALLHQQGRNIEALEYLDAALKLNPTNVSALTNLGLVYAKTGRPEEALATYDKAVAIKSDHLTTLINRGTLLIDLKRPDEALESYDRVLAIKPDHARALYSRANALLMLGRFEEAVQGYDMALALMPDYSEALNNRGNALKELNRMEEALRCYDKALALNPDYPEALNNRGVALRAFNRHSEALACYEKALALNPDSPEAYDNKSVALRELGRVEEAKDAIETAIELAAPTVHLYYNLSLVRRFVRDDVYIRAMEELDHELARLGKDDQIQLQFALGKAYADIGDNDRSFRHLLHGNTLRREITDYDEAAILALTARTQAAFTRELLHSKAGLGDPSRVPVFIVGMPRSGTTLVEQILASHSKVFGAGEIDELGKAILDLGNPERGIMQFPEIVSSISGQGLRQLGENYVRRIRSYRAGHSADHQQGLGQPSFDWVDPSCAAQCADHQRKPRRRRHLLLLFLKDVREFAIQL